MRASHSVLAAVALSLAGCATGGADAPAAPKTSAPARAAAPVFRLADIEGAAPARVDALLGAPKLTRREGAGEYRRYALSNCALIVIFYPDASGAPKAAHVDATALTSDGDKPDLADCLAQG